MKYKNSTIPDDTPDWEIPDRVRESRIMEDMYYVGCTVKHSVPFLIKPDR